MTTQNKKVFPTNPFLDVSPKDFHKMNKKHISEDYVGENFRIINWEVYTPFNDTGIDRVISKYICPNNHTAYNENLLNTKCPICQSEPKRIYRFIQIKTREVKNTPSASDTFFGYTLKTKDFRTDPRHIFLFYSDHTNDFFLLSVYEYLRFFDQNNINFHETPTFKQGNGKINSLKYNKGQDKWVFNKISWEPYRNIEGLKTIQNYDYDRNIEQLIKETSELKKRLFYKFSSGRTLKENIVPKINKFIKENNINKNNEYFTNSKLKYTKKLRSFNPPVKESINKYYSQFEGIEIL